MQVPDHYNMNFLWTRLPIMVVATFIFSSAAWQLQRFYVRQQTNQNNLFAAGLSTSTAIESALIDARLPHTFLILLMAGGVSEIAASIISVLALDQLGHIKQKILYWFFVDNASACATSLVVVFEYFACQSFHRILMTAELPSWIYYLHVTVTASIFLVAIASSSIELVTGDGRYYAGFLFYLALVLSFGCVALWLVLWLIMDDQSASNHRVHVTAGGRQPLHVFMQIALLVSLSSITAVVYQIHLAIRALDGQSDFDKQYTLLCYSPSFLIRTFAFLLALWHVSKRINDLYPSKQTPPIGSATYASDTKHAYLDGQNSPDSDWYFPGTRPLLPHEYEETSLNFGTPPSMRHVSQPSPEPLPDGSPMSPSLHTPSVYRLQQSVRDIENTQGGTFVVITRIV